RSTDFEILYFLGELGIVQYSEIDRQGIREGLIGDVHKTIRAAPRQSFRYGLLSFWAFEKQHSFRRGLVQDEPLFQLNWVELDIVFAEKFQFQVRIHLCIDCSQVDRAGDTV